MRRTKTIALALILIGFMSLGVTSATSQTQKLQHKEIELKSTSAQLKQLNLDYEHLNLKLDQVDKTNSKEIKRLKEEKESLEKEKARLERELVSKRNEENGLNNASTRIASALGGTQTAHAQESPTNGCGELRSKLSALGISGAELNAAITLSTRESGCRSSAINPSSKACGEFQSYPCGKWGSPGTTAYLRGAIGYVNSTYGGFVGALNHSYANNWY